MRKLLMIGSLLMMVAACGRRPVASLAAVEPRHLISMKKPKEALYLDRLDNRVVLANVDTAGPTTFCSFLVGMRDSLFLADGKRVQEREKYLQYDMQRDWTVIVGGDSLKPVFFQEKAHLDGLSREGALVFEVPRGQRADTLVFRDTYGDWGTQVFILNDY
jgi:hypothetical protein